MEELLIVLQGPFLDRIQALVARAAVPLSLKLDLRAVALAPQARDAPME